MSNYDRWITQTPEEYWGIDTELYEEVSDNYSNEFFEKYYNRPYNFIDSSMETKWIDKLAEAGASPKQIANFIEITVQIYESNLFPL
jgi:hypothetical protein